jgi:hypothetical protein
MTLVIASAVQADVTRVRSIVVPDGLPESIRQYVPRALNTQPQYKGF